MANQSRGRSVNEGPRSENNKFIVTTIIAVVGFGITIGFNILNYISNSNEQAFRITEAKTKEINDYQNRVAATLADNRRLYNQYKKGLFPVTVVNLLDSATKVELLYSTINEHWIAEGHFKINPRDSVFLGPSSARNVYLAFSQKFAIPKYCNNQELALADTNQVVIRKEGFQLDVRQICPYTDTLTRTFYRVSLYKDGYLFLSNTLIKL